MSNLLTRKSWEQVRSLLGTNPVTPTVQLQLLCRKKNNDKIESEAHNKSADPSSCEKVSLDLDVGFAKC